MESTNNFVPKKVILDTNILLAPGQFRVDIFSDIEGIMDVPYKLYIIDKTIDELEKIRKKAKLPDRQAANIALQLLDRKNIERLDTDGVKGKIVDDYICNLSDKDTVVATSDRKLIMRLKRNHIKIIELAQKKYLRIG